MNISFNLGNKLFRNTNYSCVLIHRLIHKVDKKNNNESVKISKSVQKFLDQNPELSSMQSTIPSFLFKQHKSPESLYLINKQTATTIGNVINNYLNENSTVIEVDPGLGYLSEVLLLSKINHLYMYEPKSCFAQRLKEIQNKFSKRATLKEENFFIVQKLANKDKADNEKRLSTFLEDLTTKNNKELKIVGAMANLIFIRHIINNIIFNNITQYLGRLDVFVLMPKTNYELLTDENVKTGSSNKFTPIMFQLLFESQILMEVPKEHFLPWCKDSDNLYLVNIKEKEKLPCPSEYLPIMWYFFRPHLNPRSKRIIPKLEQWIPGCGVWLITGQDPPDTRRNLAPTENDAKLPHMTIFTLYKDLTLEQKVTLFKRFISWAEFEQSLFRSSMESNLPKYILPNDDDED